MRLERIPYMRWAKETFDRQTDIHNLGTSGILSLIPPEELGIGPADFPRPDVRNEDGHPALREAIAGRYGVRPESVLVGEGTSLANFLICAALVRPGDEVILEEPYYQPLRSVLDAFGARIRFVPVDHSEGHAAILDALAGARTRVRAVVITNPHNPTGRVVEDPLLGRLATACEPHGATLVVDEVYREVLFEDPPGCAARIHPSIVSTSSLTKVWGLSHLRIGWAIGPPPLIARAIQLNDNLGVVHPYITEAAGARLIRDRAGMDRWRERARARVSANRATVARLLASTPQLEGSLSDAGIINFPRWRGSARFPDAESLCERALREKRIAIVPGRFFQRADHVRIGAGGPEEKVAAACDALAAYVKEE